MSKLFDTVDMLQKSFNEGYRLGKTSGSLLVASLLMATHLLFPYDHGSWPKWVRWALAVLMFCTSIAIDFRSRKKR